MIIDLRSDTVTRPTSAMRAAMFDAPVGDDVFGDDPSVNALETEAARLFGKEAALFCPSGTMTNQIAIAVHCRPGDEVVCDRLAHIYMYEGGGIARHAGASVALLAGDRGRFRAADVTAAINPDDVHRPRTRLVAVENTVNRGGGAIWDRSELAAIATLCRERGLAFHLDGAPVGSLLLGTAAFIKEARRMRKVFGGGMRQAGFLAAAGSYALAHQVERLRDDHRRARTMGAALAACPWVERVLPVDTNIVIASLNPGVSETAAVARLKEAGVLASGFGPGMVRFVFHLDVDDAGLEQAVSVVRGLKL